VSDPVEGVDMAYELMDQVGFFRDFDESSAWHGQHHQACMTALFHSEDGKEEALLLMTANRRLIKKIEDLIHSELP